MDVENNASLPHEPPPPPRFATFSGPKMGISSFFKRTWGFLLLFLFVSGAIYIVSFMISSRVKFGNISSGSNGFPLIPEQPQSSPPPGIPWYVISTIVTAAFWVFSCTILVFWFRRRVRWEHNIFLNGIPAIATVTEIKLHTSSDSSRIHQIVHWSYTVGSKSHSNKTDKESMPGNTKPDDEFWVLYD